MGGNVNTTTCFEIHFLFVLLTHSPKTFLVRGRAGGGLQSTMERDMRILPPPLPVAPLGMSSALNRTSTGVPTWGRTRHDHVAKPRSSPLAGRGLRVG